MTYQIEMTDTFGGEANYCWARHAHIPADGLSDRALVRRAKAWAGYTGRRCRVDNYGDTIAIYPSGDCVVIFVSWVDSANVRGDAI